MHVVIERACMRIVANDHGVERSASGDLPGLSEGLPEAQEAPLNKRRASSQQAAITSQQPTMDLNMKMKKC